MNRLNFFIYTILFISFLITFKKGQIIKLNGPYKFINNWEKRTIEELKCPTRPLDYLNIKKVINLNSFTFGFKSKRLAEGYFCIKRKLITRCFENFFGAQWVDQREVTLKVTPSECKNGLYNYKNGGNRHYVYPPADCKWMATHEEFLIYIQILPRRLPFDVYKNGIVDSRFSNGICQDDICKEFILHGYWIFSSKDSNFCGIKEKLKAYIYRDELDSHIFTNFAYNKLLSQSCKITICGVDGIRFNDGKWIAYSDNLIRECSKNETIFEYSIKGEILIEEIKLEEKILHFECKRMLKEAIKNKKADTDLLKILTPLTPGLYYTQRLMGLNLPYVEERKAFFESISLFKNKTYNNCIGHSKNNLCIKHSDYYSPSGYGPMGLYTVKGNLIYNPDDLHKYHNDIIEDNESNVIEIKREKELKYNETEVNSNDFINSIKGKTIQSISIIFKKISDFFNAIFTNLSHIFLFLCMIILTCLFIYCILKEKIKNCFKRQFRGNYNQNVSDDLEFSNRNLM